MPVFAITGNLASGKSTLLKLLRERGAVVLNVDRVIHKYYRDKKSSIYKKIVSLFPQAVVGGVISRKKLGEVVFSSKNRLAQLEGIVHPVIMKDLKAWIKDKRRKKRVYVAEVPLLFEKNLQPCFDGVILVYVRREVLVRRIREKLNISTKQSIKRLSLYVPIKEKIKKADFVIDNSFSLQNLKRRAEELWEKMKWKTKK
jgi:dephospho-CoA kinase